MARKARAAGVEQLGQRLRRFRRERAITQAELAEALGTTQAVVSDYERGKLRLHGELIIELSRILRLTADELLGLGRRPPNGKPANVRFLRRLREIDRLSEREQRTLLQTLDAFLDRARLKSPASASTSRI